MATELEKLDPLSEEYDALATVLFADAWPTETDKEGRIILQDGLLGHAGIARTGSVAFVGLGTRFQSLASETMSPRTRRTAQHSAYRARATRPMDVAAPERAWRQANQETAERQRRGERRAEVTSAQVPNAQVTAPKIAPRLRHIFP